MTLYEFLSARAAGLSRWLPLNIHRRGKLPATPRRIAWAKRELARGDYPSRVLSERLGGPEAACGPEAEVSIESVLRSKGLI